MSENGTRAIVRELYDAYGRRDFERVAALIHDDIDWIIYAPMSVFPFAGPRHAVSYTHLTLPTKRIV